MHRDIDPSVVCESEEHNANKKYMTYGGCTQRGCTEYYVVVISKHFSNIDLSQVKKWKAMRSINTVLLMYISKMYT